MANFVGIDIGSQYTKVVELEHKIQTKLNEYIIFKTPYLPEGQHGQRQIDKNAFWQEITKQIPIQKIKASDVSINIPSGVISVTTLLLPRVARHELNVVAQTEAKRKMIPASGPNHIFENTLIGEKIVAKIPRFEVMVVRADKLFIQKTVDIFKDMDITPALITPSCFAALNVFSKDAWSKEDDTAFVDIGASTINISICKEAKLIFTRNVVYGLEDIVKDISRQIGLSEDEVDKAVREYGIPQVAFDLRDKVALAEEIMRQKYELSLKPEAVVQNQVNLLELRMLWQGHIERIIQELRRSFIFYKEQSEGRRINRICFLGGGSQIKNLITALSALIGGQCQIVLPFRGVQMPKEKLFEDELAVTPVFTDAAGLAAAFIVKDKKEIAINFLPVELKRKKILAKRRLVFVSAGIVLTAGFSLLLIKALLTNLSLKSSIQNIESQLNNAKDITDRLKKLNRQEEKVQRLFLEIESIIQQRRQFYSLLRGLVKNLPSQMLLTKIAVSGTNIPAIAGEMSNGSDAGNEQEGSCDTPEDDSGSTDVSSQAVAQGRYQIEITGWVLADYEQAAKLIEQFRTGLESSGYFDNINIPPLELEKVSSQQSGINGDSSLTQIKIRNFTVTAELR
ncbi:MAG: pilus assembly protein PilM [Candidatus Omnitrophota bacterium]